MKFSLLVYAAPDRDNHACQFAESLLQQGHQLYRVYFYGDGIYHATQISAGPFPPNSIPPNSSGNCWQQLAGEHTIDLCVCSNAVDQRGLSQSAATAAGPTLLAGFELAGLAQLTDAALQSDRVITFG